MKNIPPPPPKKTGRPSIYSEELVNELCGYLAQGMSMKRACEQPGMPTPSTVFQWLSDKPGFSDKYARAKEEACEALAEEMFDIADDGSNDYMEVFDKNGEAVGYKLNGEHVNRSRLRVDTRKWYISKIKPKKYGDKLAVGGADDLPDMKVSVTRTIVDPTKS